MTILVESSPTGTIWFAFGLFFAAAAAAALMGTNYRRLAVDIAPAGAESALSIATM